MSALAGAYAITAAVCALVLAVYAAVYVALLHLRVRGWRRFLIERTPTPCEHIDICGRVTDLENRAHNLEVKFERELEDVRRGSQGGAHRARYPGWPPGSSAGRLWVACAFAGAVVWVPEAAPPSWFGLIFLAALILALTSTIHLVRDVVVRRKEVRRG